MRFGPDAHDAPREATTAARGQPRVHQPHCYEGVEVEEEEEDPCQEAEAEEAGEEKEEDAEGR